jgi:hypothetical protein
MTSKSTKKALLPGWLSRDGNRNNGGRKPPSEEAGDKMSRSTVEPIDNSIGLNSGGVNANEIMTILEKYAYENNNHGFTHVAMLSPGGDYAIAGPDIGDSREKIEGVIGDRQFIVHMNGLFDLQSKINERAHKAGIILEVVIMCEELTFALNLFGRKNIAEDKYYVTEVVIPIVATRAYLGALVQKNSAKLVADLRALVKAKRSPPKK